MEGTTDILGSQNVKAGIAPWNCLHQITQHRDERYEPDRSMAPCILESLLVFFFG